MKKRKEEVRGERIWGGWRPASHGQRDQKRKKGEEKGKGNENEEIEKISAKRRKIQEIPSKTVVKIKDLGE